MRPKPFASDNVEQTVSINVCERECVRLRKTNAIFRLLAPIDHQAMLLKCDLSFFADLLEPRQSPAMRIQRCDDVVVAIAIDVVSKHLRAAFAAEAKRMFDPDRFPVRRLLPPAIV